jgi:hypothetical protein
VSEVGGPGKGPATNGHDSNDTSRPVDLVDPLIAADVVTDGGFRRLIVRHHGARMTLTASSCPPLAAAVEVAAIAQWAWGIVSDVTVPVAVAALR